MNILYLIPHRPTRMRTGLLTSQIKVVQIIFPALLRKIEVHLYLLQKENLLRFIIT